MATGAQDSKEGMDGSNGADDLTQRRDGTDNTKIVPLSPTKSGITSEEEGEVEEGEKVSSSPSRSSRRESPNAAFSHSGNRYRSSPGPLLRQASDGQTDVRYGNRWHSDHTEHHVSAGRKQSYDAHDAVPGPSRWGSYREDHRPKQAYDSYNRPYRDSSQQHDHYGPYRRSMSIGPSEEHFPRPAPYSFSAAYNEERERDLRRDFARERERDRDPHWGRARYLRNASPSQASMTDRGMQRHSGSFSGPTSPSNTRKPSVNPGLGGWDADRNDWERAPYHSSRESGEVRADNSQRRHHRSPPQEETRGRSSSDHRTRGNNTHLKQPFLTSPAVNNRPRELQETASSPKKTTPERPVTHIEDSKAGIISASSSLETIKEQRSPDDQDAAPIESVVVSETASTLPPTDPTPTLIKDKIVDSHWNEAPSPVHFKPLLEDRSRSLNEATSGPETDAVAGPAVDDEGGTVRVVDNASAYPQFELETVGEASRTTSLEDAHIMTRPEQISNTPSEIAQHNTSPSEAGPSVKVEETNADLTIAITTSDADIVMHQSTSKSMNDSEHKPAVEPTNEVKSSSIDSATDHEQTLLFLPSSEVQTEDAVSQTAVSTPRSRDEQDRVKRAAIWNLLGELKPDEREITRVMRYNKKLLATMPLNTLDLTSSRSEMAHKRFTDLWLDDEDKEVQAMRHKMMKATTDRQKRLNAKVEHLRNRYRFLNKDWQRHCAKLDRMSEARESQNRPALHSGVSSAGTGTGSLMHGSAMGPLPGSGAGPSDENVGILSSLNPSMTRANRRNTQTGFAGFGDAVRSEAEFLEILASLENADMQDPNMRAARTTATEPEMILNPDAKTALLNSYDDDNGYVANPVAFYCSNFDPDLWLEEEKVVFERRYALYPKQFGKIAASLPHKTAKQCVRYYYLTKHTAGYDYKSLSAARNRDRKRKTRVKPKKGRGSALMADLKGDEAEEEDQVPSPGEGTMSEKRGSARSRVLTTSTISGELVVVSEDVDEEAEQSSGRKRRADEIEGEDRKGRQAGKPKRSKSEKKGKSVPSTPVEEVNGEAKLHGDLDLAAAEALGALAGRLSAGDTPGSVVAEGGQGGSRKKKSGGKVAGSVTSQTETLDDGAAKRSRQTTSSYWSVAERNEFLRSLAVWGKEWDAIATTLSTKSAAQARNYFARNADESEFVEALEMAKENAALSLSERQDLAATFIQKRSTMATDRTQQTPMSGFFSSRPSPSTAEATSPAPRWLNINNLLNEETPAETGRRASLNEWFGKEEGKDGDSNDDTEEDEQVRRADDQQPPHRFLAKQEPQQKEPSDYFGSSRPEHYGGSGAAAAAPNSMPPSRYLTMNQLHHRRSPSSLSSMPPPSAFIQPSRYQLLGQRSPLSSFQPSLPRSATSSQSPSEGHPTMHGYSQERGGLEREPTSSWRPNYASATPDRPTSLSQQRHASWPNAYTSSHGISPGHHGASSPPLPIQHSSHQPPNSHGFDGRSELSSSLSPYGPRPATTTGGAGMTSLHPPPPPLSRSPYERPHSSGHTSSIRSLSPHPPPPRLPPLNQSLFSHRHDASDSPR